MSKQRGARRPLEREVAGFASSMEHIQAELGRVDALIEGALERIDGELSLRGQVGILQEEILRLLPRLGHRVPAPLAPLAATRDRLDLLAEAHSRRLRVSVDRGIPLRLLSLAGAFGLSAVDVDLLLIALAPEIDLRYQRIYAYLQDDLTRRRPTVDLALALVAGNFAERVAVLAAFAADQPLIRYGLVEILPDPVEPDAPLLAGPLRVDPAIVAFLLEQDSLPQALAGVARILPGEGPPALQAALGGELSSRLARLAGDMISSDEEVLPPLIHVQGPRGCGEEAVARALAAPLGMAIAEVDGAALASLDEAALSSRLSLMFRDSHLRSAVILWLGFDPMLARERQGAYRVFCRALRAWSPVVVLAGEAAYEPQRRDLPGGFVPIRLLRPSIRQQGLIWREVLRAYPAGPDVDLDRITAAFSLTPGAIQDAAAAAAELAAWRDPDAPVLCQRELLEACRRSSSPQLGRLAQRLPTDRGWDRLVVAGATRDLLQELCDQVRLRSRVIDAWGFGSRISSTRGVRALFTGPPGTGKTLAASVIARELGIEVYRIDLSSVVSKYIGETEKHLGQVFDEAEASSAVLFFDEADALFAKRTEVKDSHDRYANLETSYLLQRMEVYEGLVILASNLRSNMDPAFVRRMSFIIAFEEPTSAERHAIWRAIWPLEAPLADEVDLRLIARRFALSGGMIRNAALAAAFRAAADGGAATTRHILHAIRRELEKAGRMIDEGAFRALEEG